MEDGFTMPSEPGSDDGDMTRLVLQHCVMPAYQFFIQVAPDQSSVTQFNFSIIMPKPNVVHESCCMEAGMKIVLLLV